MNMAFAFERRLAFLAEQRNESYRWYDEMSSAGKNASLAPKVLSGRWLCQLAGKGGA